MSTFNKNQKAIPYEESVVLKMLWSGNINNNSSVSETVDWYKQNEINENEVGENEVNENEVTENKENDLALLMNDKLNLLCKYLFNDEEEDIVENTNPKTEKELLDIGYQLKIENSNCKERYVIEFREGKGFSWVEFKDKRKNMCSNNDEEEMTTKKLKVF